MGVVGSNSQREPKRPRDTIDSLLESLDQTIDERAEEVWKLEIERRLEQIDGGAVKLVSWHDARQRLRDRLDTGASSGYESIRPR
jgi:hypothetical protein